MKTTHANPTEQINVNAFMSLSQIAFSSVERLATLNLTTTRAAFDKNLALSGVMLQAGNGEEQKNAAEDQPGKLANNALSYLQSVQEIAAETQKEVADLMASYFSTPANGGKPGAAWARGFEMFKDFGQQITSMTEASSRAIGEVATRTMESAEAGGRAAGEATKRATDAVLAPAKKH